MAVVAIAVAIVITTQSAYDEGGPLSSEVESGVDATLPIGEIETWGVILPRPIGATEVTIESVTPAESPVGVTLLGIDIAPVEQVAIGTLRTYPPPGLDLRDVEGFVFGTGERRVQLILGIRFDGPAPGLIDGLRIRYAAQGHRYETVLRVRYRVTPP